jgi:hypothetical protein
MDVSIYKFPTVEDGIDKVEAAFSELMVRRRNGEELEEEVIDWLDYANACLISVSTNNRLDK